MINQMSCHFSAIRERRETISSRPENVKQK